MAGQKILCSGRASITPASEGTTKINNGDTIKAKAHAEIGTITHLSITGAETLGRPNVDVNGGKPPPNAPGFMRC
jgi:hypothetical protein